MSDTIAVWTTIVRSKRYYCASKSDSCKTTSEHTEHYRPVAGRIGPESDHHKNQEPQGADNPETTEEGRAPLSVWNCGLHQADPCWRRLRKCPQSCGPRQPQTRRACSLPLGCHRQLYGLGSK